MVTGRLGMRVERTKAANKEHAEWLDKFKRGVGQSDGDTKEDGILVRG